MTAGRPKALTEEVKAVLLQRIAEGESVSQICADESMPARSTVYATIADDAEFADRYARAKDVCLELLSDQLLAIADDGTDENVQRARLRVDTRKWIMSKLAPKKYGDRLVNEHTGKDGGPIETADLSGYEIARRVAFMLAAAKPDGDANG